MRIRRLSPCVAGTGRLPAFELLHPPFSQAGRSPLEADQPRLSAPLANLRRVGMGKGESLVAAGEPL